MTVPSAYTTALTADGIVCDFWLEIEGLPYGYGFNARTSSFFTGRSTIYRRESVKALLASLPSGAEQEVRPLDGDSSIGQLNATIVDDDDGSALALLSNVGRRDKQLRLGPSKSWAGGVLTAIGDLIRPTASSTAQRGWYRCTTGGTTHATVEPTWPLSGTVNDNGVVWTFQAAIDLPDNATAVNVPYAGTADATDYPTGGGVFYCGRETFAYTGRTTAGNGGGYFTGITRCYYSLDNYTSTQAHTWGDVITPYARFLTTRRATLYATLDASDANKVARWSGTVKNCKFVKGATAVEIQMETIESEFKITAFRTQRLGKLTNPMGGEKGPSDYSGPVKPWGSGMVSFESDEPNGKWLKDTFAYVQIDDEIMLVYVAVGDDSVPPGRTFAYDRYAYAKFALSEKTIERGLFKTKAVQHEQGAQFKEVMVLARRDLNSLAYSQSKFTAGHPFDIVRVLLASRNGDGANGGYDLLPFGWGAGIDQARIDNTGIEALKSDWVPDVLHDEIITEPFDLKAKIAEILRPLGCYTVQLIDNQLAIRRMNPPTALTPTVTIDTSKIIAVTGWDANTDGVVGKVVFNCDHNTETDKYERVFKHDLTGPNAEAQEFYAGIYRTVTVDAKGLESIWGAEPAARAYVDLVRDRYSKPGPLITVECSYDLHTVNVGELVLFTEPNVPNVSTGSRGMTSVICEINRKQVDDVNGKVILTLQQTYYSDQYRLIGPSATINAWNAGTMVATCNAHDYTAATAAVDVAGFAIGDTVEVMTANLATTRGTSTISGINAGTNTITLNSAPAGTVATDIILCRTYDNATASRKARSAFLCGADNPPTLGATSLASPHEFTS